ncbi:uncharacterized protein si:dkey-148h10.5 [Electrophorus electricus]|uniref:uncharacterized protein si:dkey-148h10.5 n=1 Tax=Electrophorus electricus TaxID=8005 RepID=UPI0015D01F56|nr:uncharacterized protein si:dkey-148h10.5 [Electrophorus electricus]
MPAKRNLRLEDKENTPFKRHAPARNYSPVTGTMPITPTAKTHDLSTFNPSSGNRKTIGRTVISPETKEPLSETERMFFFRSKTEECVEILMRTRQQLETFLPVEGNSELRSFLLMGPSDLVTELKRHKELTAKVECCVNAAQIHKSCLQGTTQTGSSYEFLKKILRG